MNAKLSPNQKSNRLWPILLMATLLVLTSIACPGYQQVNENSTLLVDVGRPIAWWVVWSPANDEIAISAADDRLGIVKIHIYNLSDDRSRLFLHPPKPSGLIGALDWSPDGKKLILISYGSKIFGEGVWIVDRYKRDSPEYLGKGNDAAWSSTNMIAIDKCCYSEDILTITVVNYLTGEKNVVYEATGKAINGMSWSPDGKELVFGMRDRLVKEDGDIFILSIETGIAQQFTTDKKNLSPEWSPNGNVIAYTKKVEGDQLVPDNVLYIMNSNGSCEVPVPGITDAWDPTWSPDGKSIAYVSDGDVYLVDLISIFGEKFLIEGMNCQ